MLITIFIHTHTLENVIIKIRSKEMFHFFAVLSFQRKRECITRGGCSGKPKGMEDLKYKFDVVCRGNIHTQEFEELQVYQIHNTEPDYLFSLAWNGLGSVWCVTCVWRC